MGRFQVMAVRFILAERLKEVFYPDKPWHVATGGVSFDMTMLIRAGRLYYPNMDEVEMIRELAHYDDKGLREAYEIAKTKEGVCKGENRQGNSGQHLTASMATNYLPL